MPVYVDHARNSFGPMALSHMAADTTEELLAMADTIGLKRKWIRCLGKPEEHFDVSEGMRFKALIAGAIPVESISLVLLRQRRRQAVGGR